MSNMCQGLPADGRPSGSGTAMESSSLSGGSDARVSVLGGSPMASHASTAACASPAAQGLTLVHFSAYREHCCGIRWVVVEFR